MTRPSDKYIDIWLEHVRRERKRNPFDRAQVDFETWEALLVEIQRCRASHPARGVVLTEDDRERLVEVLEFIQEQIDSGADTCGQHRLQVAVLARLVES